MTTLIGMPTQGEIDTVLNAVRNTPETTETICSRLRTMRRGKVSAILSQLVIERKICRDSVEKRGFYRYFKITNGGRGND